MKGRCAQSWGRALKSPAALACGRVALGGCGCCGRAGDDDDAPIDATAALNFPASMPARSGVVGGVRTLAMPPVSGGGARRGGGVEADPMPPLCERKAGWVVWGGEEVRRMTRVAWGSVWDGAGDGVVGERCGSGEPGFRSQMSEVSESFEGVAPQARVGELDAVAEGGVEADDDYVGDEGGGCQPNTVCRASGRVVLGATRA